MARIPRIDHDAGDRAKRFIRFVRIPVAIVVRQIVTMRMDGSTYIVESLPAVRTAEKAGTAAYTAGGGGAIGGNQEYPARCGDD